MKFIYLTFRVRVFLISIIVVSLFGIWFGTEPIHPSIQKAIQVKHVTPSFVIVTTTTTTVALVPIVSTTVVPVHIVSTTVVKKQSTSGITKVPVHQSTIVPVVSSHPGGRWGCIKQHESGGNYANADTGRNGHYGAYQFSPGTWNYAVGLIGQSNYANGRADKAPPSIQDAVAVALQAKVGWSPWAGDGC